MPTNLEEGKLYISVEFCTALHLCCCGCGNKVVTPLSPHRWQMTFDGETVSLHPSIGNWSYPCQSHYWIERSQVVPARKWSQREIAKGRLRDGLARRAYYQVEQNQPVDAQGVVTMLW